jgi:hypothetical protein
MSHPDPTQDYPCETCGEQPQDCACADTPAEPVNEIEIAVNEYVAANLHKLEPFLRHAFLDGVGVGIHLTEKIHNP